jgi:hypothetical protein
MLLLCFLLPLMTAFRVTLVGEVGLSEPLLLICLICSLRRAKEIFALPVARTFLFLGAIWLISQIAVDLYRDTPFQDYSRGWAKIAMLLVSYVACFVLIGFDFRRITAFALGMATAPICNYLVFRTDLALYKFVFGFVISLGSFFIIGWSQKPRVWLAIIPAMAGLLAMSMDSRSLAGITFSAAAYYAIVSTGLIRQEVHSGRKFLFALVWTVIAYSSVGVYSHLAGQGKLAEDAVAKYDAQVGTSEKFNVLMGRSEVFYSVPKILESPIVGYGSWAKDIDYVTKRSLEQGYNPDYIIASTGGLIPTHSHFFGAWLEAGIVGAIFWGYALWLIAGILWSGWLGGVARWSGVCSFLLILFAWDIVFSPFGGERRLNNGFYLWIVTFFVLAVREHKLHSWVTMRAAGASIRPQVRRHPGSGGPRKREFR